MLLRKRKNRKVKICVLIPAYNAAKTLGEVLQRIDLPSSNDEIIVVDDGSHDGTAQVAQMDPRVFLHQHSMNQGYGAVSATLYNLAIQSGADITVNVHSDGAHFPEDIPAVIQPILAGQADMVVGSRTQGIILASPRVLGSRVIGASLLGPMPFHRFVPNLVLTTFQNLCYGTRFHTFHDGFRACTRRTLQVVPYADLTTWYQYDTEFLLAAHERGLRIVEVPVQSFYSPHAGSATPSIAYGLRVVWHALTYYLKGRERDASTILVEQA
jgi:glycosyltransferase involved in cell wall biosynthesis